MPKVWKVYERARGIALTRERFQFIFDLETDIQTVLRQGFWTFDDWGMAIERWVEHPPVNYLQTAAIWVRFKNLPANYLTTKTMDIVADGIGHVEVIEFDPGKPLLNDNVCVQVRLDLNLPLRDKKSVTLPGGRIEYVDVEYERVRKKCFHCFRLSLEKQKCPLFQGCRNRGKGIVNRQIVTEGQSSSHRQHHNDLAEKLMPLLAPTIPPGFENPSTMVAPEVFEQMQIYMSVSDPEERRLREAKMRKTLNELSNDPVAQRSCLRLEMAPKVTAAVSKDRGKVFDYSRVQETHLTDISVVSAKKNDNVLLNKGYNVQYQEDVILEELTERDPAVGGFVMGSNDQLDGDRSSRSGNSWKRRKQGSRNVAQSPMALKNRDREEGSGKRKALEDGEVSSKVLKQSGGLMVHQKPSNPQ
ncbi:uncharacterized protein LOC130495835 [Raphanus sativus]|uniref:Uncharacterized protein LOC130495835 n=1 Tax=Raphanus sativus TaxID=3726 RepID=A0A9W3BVT1_RAPSA|nr:uncharacterized protein LOC130495835 [Raphanus sativus]